MSKNTPKSSAPPVPIRVGRVTITGSQLELDQDFSAAIVHAARTRRFAEHVLGNLQMLEDLDRHRARAGQYLQVCLQAGDVAGVERWASLALALDELSDLSGADLERHWPPSSGVASVEHVAATPEELASEAAAAAELEAERERLRGAGALVLTPPTREDLEREAAHREIEHHEDGEPHSAFDDLEIAGGA